MTALVYVSLLLVAITGTGVVLSHSPRRQVFALGANGLALAVVFMTLQAPDVAFAEIVVGAVALPLMFLAVLASINMDHAPRGAQAGRDGGRGAALDAPPGDRPRDGDAQPADEAN